MRSFTKLLLRIRTLLHRDTVEHELSDELRFHLEQQTTENIAAGMSPQDARMAALRQLGGIAQIEEECRDTRGVALFESLLQDIRYGLRQLRRSPGFTVVAVLTLALGIGANTAIFTVMNALMFKSLPVKEPAHLAQVIRSKSDADLTYALFKEIKARQDVFSDLFASTGGSFDLSNGGERQIAHGILVSGGFFSTLGVPAILGRTISQEDDKRGAAPVAVISYTFWQAHFSGDREVLGRWITLDKHPLRIIGVTPKGFYGAEIGDRFDVAIPLEAERIVNPVAGLLDEPLASWLYVIGRLKPGVSLEQASARLKTLSLAINTAALPPQLLPGDRDDFIREPIYTVSAATGVSTLREEYGKALFLLAGMVGLLLMIACANVANLLLARARARNHEFAIRVALGARRIRVAQQVLTESLLLASFGAIVGLAFARWAGQLLVVATSPDRYRWSLDLSLDWRVWGVVLGATVITSILFGSGPAVWLAKAAPQSALSEKTRIAGCGRWWEPPRLLIVGQVALSLLLVYGAALLVRSLQTLLSQDLGFQTQGVLLLDTDIELRNSNRERQFLISNLMQRFQALPNVHAASRSVVTPISGMSWQWNVMPADNLGTMTHVYLNLVSPDYFDVIGIPWVRGRKFTEHDNASAPLIAIVSETAAKQIFPKQQAIGQSFTSPAIPGKYALVVGIVRDAKYRELRDPAPPTIYLPIAQSPSSHPVIGTFTIRYSGPLAAAVKAVQRAALSVDPQLSLEFTPLSTQVRNSLRQERLLANLSAAFSVLALILACVGIYGVMAYSVARRRNEIGIRIALGAASTTVLTMVLREGLLTTIAGIALGIPLALMASKTLKTLLFGVAPVDAMVIAGTVGVMLILAMTAAYLPARRAARVDPMVALRYE